MKKTGSKPREPREVKKRVFTSMESFDQAFFPSQLAERQDDVLSEEPSKFGTKLANEVLEDIRRALH